MTALFCRKVDDFAPVRSGGEWAPAEWRPAMKKVSAYTGAEAGAVQLRTIDSNNLMVLLDFRRKLAAGEGGQVCYRPQCSASAGY